MWRTGGQYYKGEIVNVRQMQPSITSSLAQREAYDPWEALDVKWEMGGALEAEEGGCLRVSPWEIEADPETEARRLEELRKQEEASARAARALAKSRRYVHLWKIEGQGGSRLHADVETVSAAMAGWLPVRSGPACASARCERI